MMKQLIALMLVAATLAVWADPGFALRPETVLQGSGLEQLDQALTATGLEEPVSPQQFEALVYCSVELRWGRQQTVLQSLTQAASRRLGIQLEEEEALSRLNATDDVAAAEAWIAQHRPHLIWLEGENPLPRPATRWSWANRVRGFSPRLRNRLAERCHN